MAIYARQIMAGFHRIGLALAVLCFLAGLISAAALIKDSFDAEDVILLIVLALLLGATLYTLSLVIGWTISILVRSKT